MQLTMTSQHMAERINFPIFQSMMGPAFNQEIGNH